MSISRSKHNIFYHNIEPKNPDDLEDIVVRELLYFKKYLQKSIDSLDIKRYELEWEKDEYLYYHISPHFKINVKKPKLRLLLKLSESEFNPQIPILNDVNQLVSYTFVSTNVSRVLVEIMNKESVNQDTKLYYGIKPIEWEVAFSGFPEKIEHLSDENNKIYNVLSQEDSSDYIIFELNKEVSEGIELYFENQRLEYELITKVDPEKVTLYDDSGELKFNLQNRSRLSFSIQCSRKLKGKLRDRDGNRYTYKEDSRKDQEDGVWIVLNEPDGEYSFNNDEQSHLIDLFLDILSTSIDQEIWEKPDLKPGPQKREGKIKVRKIERDEQRLFLEREPSVSKIYPPKSTYQLEMQKNAVVALMNYPAKAHRNLLKLFEPYEYVEWGHPKGDKAGNSFKWEFLTDINRDGTREQRNFVTKALCTPDFGILEGPPGSGKTTAISELIYQLLLQKKRVLLCASTHVAIDNVLEKMEEKFPGEKGLLENGIVPLRIGLESNVSEQITKYQIENRLSELETKIAGKTWFEALEDRKKKETLEEWVIQSSNIVCGTTIGILQYPHFKKLKRDYVKPEFDYLIIDEASKTTFQELLVPAIYARKWILVGDIRQLSPTVDSLNVRMNLNGLLGNEALETALLLYMKFVFERRKNGRILSPRFVYVDSNDVIHSIASTFPKKMAELNEKEKNPHSSSPKIMVVTDGTETMDEDNFKIISSYEVEVHYPEFFDSDLIFVEKSTYESMKPFFPETHIHIAPNVSDSDDLMVDCRHCSWCEWIKKRTGKEVYEYSLPKGKRTSEISEIKGNILQAIDKSWANELAWRSKRVYELAMSIGSCKGEGSPGYYKASMHALLPPDSKEHREIWNQIEKISRVAFPSVLTSIQEGVTQYTRSEDAKTVMSHGFPEGVKEERYEKLSYQHRMHPEISKIPRELFYRGKALNDTRSILEGGRTWGNIPYQRYEHRFYWKDVPNSNCYKNVNENEIKVIFEELEAFLKWLEGSNYEDMRSASTWDVMIISFYEAQRKRIRDWIKKRYPNGNERKQTRFIVRGVRVYNYTVDKVQGREADIVFLSMVQNRRVGFMDCPNRLNVAVTRAKYQLVIVGDRKYFSQQKSSPELEFIATRANPLLNSESRPNSQIDYSR